MGIGFQAGGHHMADAATALDAALHDKHGRPPGSRVGPLPHIGANDDVGGTWLENRYPGCGVDTPNLTYTFSFRPNDWSAFFPLRDEIENYLLETARESGLYDRVRFGTKVERAEWLADRNQWQVTVTASGISISSRSG